MRLQDILFYLKELRKRTLVNSPYDIALQEAIKILSKMKEGK